MPPTHARLKSRQPQRTFAVGQRVRPTPVYRNLQRYGRAAKKFTDEILGTIVAFGPTDNAYRVKWDCLMQSKLLHTSYFEVVQENDGSAIGGSD